LINIQNILSQEVHTRSLESSGVEFLMNDQQRRNQKAMILDEMRRRRENMCVVSYTKRRKMITIK